MLRLYSASPALGRARVHEGRVALRIMRVGGPSCSGAYYYSLPWILRLSGPVLHGPDLEPIR